MTKQTQVKQFKSTGTQTEFYTWLGQVKKLMRNAGFEDDKTNFKAYITKYFPLNLELYTEVAFDDCSLYQHFLTYKD